MSHLAARGGPGMGVPRPPMRPQREVTMSPRAGAPSRRGEPDLQVVGGIERASRPSTGAQEPEDADPATPLRASPGPFELVGGSDVIRQLRGLVGRVARAPGHVLIQGPSGCGKECVARGIHDLGWSAHGSFVACDVATITDSLFTSELFGQRKGYPEVRSEGRPGLVGAAEGGALFLDEVGDASPRAQASLLRFLDDGGSYLPVGAERVRYARVRVIAATNRPLAALRADFVERFPILVEVPGLDEHLDDIPELITALLRRYARH